MQLGFPLDLLPLIACPVEGGRLLSDAPGPYVVQDAPRCASCGRTYQISAGILSVLDDTALHPDSALEMNRRDEKADASGRDEWSSPYAEAGEVRPTLEALSLQAGQSVAELGCGTGRYTVRLLAAAGAIVAVDFSLGSLTRLRDRLTADAHVALVQADVTRPVLARDAFDRLLSTLHSNLPTPDDRARSAAVAAAAVHDGGRCVISMHHYGLRDFLSGQPPTGRYADSGIFRHYLRQGEARRALSPYFGQLAFRHIHASVPGLPSVAAARLARRIPLIRSSLGRLFLAVGERPKRSATSPH